MSIGRRSGRNHLLERARGIFASLQETSRIRLLIVMLATAKLQAQRRQARIDHLLRVHLELLAVLDVVDRPRRLNSQDHAATH
jgi:hypothetical protein